MLKPIKDWDDAFANMAHVAGSEELPRLWSDSAAAYRASGAKIDQGIAYGSHPRERSCQTNEDPHQIASAA